MMTRMLRFAVVFFPLVCSGWQNQTDIPYDRYPQTRMDVLTPAPPTAKLRPAVILIHGGGWVQGTKEMSVPTFGQPYLQKGFVVATVEYRLASAAPAPAAVKDVINAIKFFIAHASQWHADPKHIVLNGGSAGGHLALMAAMSDELKGKITAVVDFYGIADAAELLAGPNQREWAVQWIPEQQNRTELARDMSPLSHIHAGLPPIIIFHGTSDGSVPYAQSERLAAALKSSQVPFEFHTVPKGEHGFTPGQMEVAFQQIFAFLDPLLTK